jgi:hypothetical protein
MADTYKEVIVQFSADTRKLTQGFKEAERRVSTFSKSINKLGKLIAGAFAARAVFNQFKSTVLDAERILDTARAVGVTADEYERLSFIIEKRLGASVGTTDMLFRGLQTRLGKGGKEINKALKTAGLDPKKLQGMSSADQVLAVISALSSVENATQRTSLAAQLLGRSVALQVNKVATAGTKELKDAADDFDRIGTALGKPGAAEAIGNLTDETDNLKRAWEVLKQRTALEAAPEITAALKSITDSGVIGDITKEVLILVKEINQLITDVKWLVGLFNSMKMPDWIKTYLKDYTGVMPMISPPNKALNSLRKFVESKMPVSAPTWTIAPGSTYGSNVTNINQTNNIKASGPESAADIQKAIRKSNEQVFRQHGWAGR